MKKILWIAAAALAVLCLGVFVSAGAEEAAEPDEWTVMFYFCGSDLESRYGYATRNLAEIMDVTFPFDYSKTAFFGSDVRPAMREIGKVNVLIETGGSREWHARDIGMDVDPGALQRWRYSCYPDGTGDVSGLQTFELMDTLPLRSMAEPETLADFIRWGARTYPARKYALVLWDHGGGAKNGLCIDDMFGGDIMYLWELKQALADGGVHLETVIIDACLMANIETAWSIRDSASWMVASEEVVPAKGTAVGKWLQALVNYPYMDGRWLGRCVCDMTGIKYANEPDDMAKSLLTWSVIDLSKIDRLMEVSGRLFQTMGNAIHQNPYLIRMFTFYILETEEYGDNQQSMRDLGSMLYNENLAYIVDTDMMVELLNALSDAVVYTIRGPGRSEARGLSICFPAGFSDEDMNAYADNFPMPRYIAFLDAISPSWTAPDWVYEQTEKHREVDEMEELQVFAEKAAAQNGLPALTFNDRNWLVYNVYYTLYKEDEDSGELIRLGRTNCGQETEAETGRIIWRASDPMHWPTVDNILCCIDLVKEDKNTRLYNIPVQINSEKAILRCGRTIYYTEEDNARRSSYEVYGIWEGYDENSDLMNRSVTPLAMLAGRNFAMLYPVAGKNGSENTAYLKSREQKMPRALNVEEIPLPAGTYYIEYEIKDLFLRTAKIDRIMIQWDGENMVFPEDFNWSGAFRVEWILDP